MCELSLVGNLPNRNLVPVRYEVVQHKLRVNNVAQLGKCDLIIATQAELDRRGGRIEKPNAEHLKRQFVVASVVMVVREAINNVHGLMNDTKMFLERFTLVDNRKAFRT